MIKNTTPLVSLLVFESACLLRNKQQNNYHRIIIITIEKTCKLNGTIHNGRPCRTGKKCQVMYLHRHQRFQSQNEQQQVNLGYAHAGLVWCYRHRYRGMSFQGQRSCEKVIFDLASVLKLLIKPLLKQSMICEAYSTQISDTFCWFRQGVTLNGFIIQQL